MAQLKNCAFIRPGGQAVKTPPFHGGNTSSILVRVTLKQAFFGRLVFCLQERLDEKNHDRAAIPRRKSSGKKEEHKTKMKRAMSREGF